MESKELAKKIYEILGPAENFCRIANCMTRLRLELQSGAPDEKTQAALKALPGVLGLNQDGPELQIVLGPGKASDTQAALLALATADGFTPEGKRAGKQPRKKNAAARKEKRFGDAAARHSQLRAKQETPVRNFFRRIANIFIPLIPGFIACGLLMGILSVAFKTDPALATVPPLEILGVLSNTIYWALNLFVGWNTAREFGGTPILGALLGALLSHPLLHNIVLFGAPLMPGRGGVISVLLVAALGAWLEQQIKKYIPEAFSLFFTPLLTLTITAMAAIYVLQPLGGLLANAIGYGATMAIERGGAFTGFLLGGLWLPMVMLGIHQAMTPIHAQLISMYGFTILLPVLAMAGGGQVGSSLAVYFKTKNRELKRVVLSALPAGLLGVGEPLIYGVTLPLGKPFLGACIGGACGGAIEAAFSVGAVTMGVSGLPLAPSTNRIFIYLLGLVIAYAAGFLATWLIGFDDPPEEDGRA